MIVVSDTTPLITLMKADKLDILGSMFGDVLIPESVFSEVTSNDTYRDEANIIRNSDYIKIVKVSDDSQVAFLQRATGLDLGESEAIIYADEVKADLLMMDEVAGRRVALNMKLPITGSVGVIIRAFQIGIITSEEAEDAFERIKRSNRHISEKLVNEALNIINGTS